MDYEKAAITLINLIKNPALTVQEKEAVESAIGMLSWAALSKSRIKNLKQKKEKR